ncbi:MAG: hypothetical protein HYX35_01160, partial [Proteobacteria bacterium]|nr:hypothetical protein [Pseudomonadota bacterium]
MRTTQLLLLSTVWCVSLGTTSAFAMMGPDESLLSKKATSVRLKDAPVQLLQDWRELGLVKTSPIDVK